MIQRHYKKFVQQALGILLLVAVLWLFIAFAPAAAHFVILLMAIVLAGAGIKNLYPYLQAKSWQKQSATVLSIHENVEEIIESESGATRYFYPDITYQYNYNGAVYKSGVISFEKQNVWLCEHNLWGDQLRDKDRYWYEWQAGSEIPVFINPRDPGQSVLIRELSPKRRSHHYALLVAGILVFMVWLLVLFITIR